MFVVDEPPHIFRNVSATAKHKAPYGAYCIAQSTEREHHEASSPGPGEEASVNAIEW